MARSASNSDTEYHGAHLDRPDHLEREQFSISDLTEEFGCTARALRFYEDEALIAPERRGTQRLYTERDRARLAWILRGKRVGLSLAEIKAAMTRALDARQRPDGIVCGSIGAVIAVVAAIEDLGLELGKDVDVFSKQSMNILPWFRKEIGVFNEDVRAAGRELARAVIGHIDGQPASALQSLSVLD